MLYVARGNMSMGKALEETFGQVSPLPFALCNIYAADDTDKYKVGLLTSEEEDRKARSTCFNICDENCRADYHRK